MGFFEDWTGYGKRWKRASLFEKTILVVLLVGTTSSITSLADNIFKWRGFILDGVEYYRSVISNPILDNLAKLGISYPKEYIDIFILYSLLVSASFRHDVYKKKYNKKEFRKELISRLLFLIILFIISSLGYTVFFWLGIAYVLLPFLILIPFLRNPLNKEVQRATLAMWGPLIFACFVVLIMAAINIGLTKPLH